MNEQISKKLRIAGLVCTVMVLYRHSLNYLAFFGNWEGEGVSRIVENISSILTEVAVPFFFVVSGFFFLRKDCDSVNSYCSMVKNKFRTLMLPFVIWNLVGMLVMGIVAFDQVCDKTFGEHLRTFLFSEWYGPLWYVRDLITIMLLVPLYGWIFKMRNYIPFIIIGALLFLYWKPVDCSWISSEGLFFFFVGGLLSKRDSLLEVKMGVLPTAVLVVTWLSLTGVIYWFSNMYVEKLCILSGMMSVWFVLDRCPMRMSTLLFRYSSFAFFLYVTHFYVEKVLKNGVASFFYGNDIAATITYLLVPIVTILLVVPAGVLWKRISPKSYSIVVGGRS